MNRPDQPHEIDLGALLRTAADRAPSTPEADLDAALDVRARVARSRRTRSVLGGSGVLALAVGAGLTMAWPTGPAPIAPATPSPTVSPSPAPTPVGTAPEPGDTSPRCGDVLTGVAATESPVEMRLDETDGGLDLRAGLGTELTATSTWSATVALLDPAGEVVALAPATGSPSTRSLQAGTALDVGARGPQPCDELLPAGPYQAVAHLVITGLGADDGTTDDTTTVVGGPWTVVVGDDGSLSLENGVPALGGSVLAEDGGAIGSSVPTLRDALVPGWDTSAVHDPLFEVAARGGLIDLDLVVWDAQPSVDDDGRAVISSPRARQFDPANHELGPDETPPQDRSTRWTEADEGWSLLVSGPVPFERVYESEIWGYAFVHGRYRLTLGAEPRTVIAEPLSPPASTPPALTAEDDAICTEQLVDHTVDDPAIAMVFDREPSITSPVFAAAHAYYSANLRYWAIVRRSEASSVHYGIGGDVAGPPCSDAWIDQHPEWR